MKCLKWRLKYFLQVGKKANPFSTIFITKIVALFIRHILREENTKYSMGVNKMKNFP